MDSNMEEQGEAAFDPYTPTHWNMGYIQAGLGLNEAEFVTLTDIIVEYMDANPHMWIQDLRVATALDGLKAKLLEAYPENFDRHEDTEFSKNVLQKLIGVVKGNRGRRRGRSKSKNLVSPEKAQGKAKKPRKTKDTNDTSSQDDTMPVIIKSEKLDSINNPFLAPRPVDPPQPFWRSQFPLERLKDAKDESELIIRAFNPFVLDIELSMQLYSLRTIACSEARQRDTPIVIEDVDFEMLKMVMTEDGLLNSDERHMIYRISSTSQGTSKYVLLNSRHLKDYLRDNKSVKHVDVLVCPVSKKDQALEPQTQDLKRKHDSAEPPAPDGKRPKPDNVNPNGSDTDNLNAPTPENGQSLSDEQRKAAAKQEEEARQAAQANAEKELEEAEKAAKAKADADAVASAKNAQALLAKSEKAAVERAKQQAEEAKKNAEADGEAARAVTNAAQEAEALDPNPATLDKDSVPSMSPARLAEIHHAQERIDATGVLTDCTHWDEDEGKEDKRSAKERFNDFMTQQLAGEAIAHWDLKEYQDACLFFGHDPDDTRTEQLVAIPGMKSLLYPWQMYCVWMLLHWCLSERNGGYLADTMGLGKTVEYLALVLVLIALHEAHDSWNDYLNPATRPQAKHTHKDEKYEGQCTFGRRLFLCPCEKDGHHARKLIPKGGANVAVVLKPNLKNWILEFNQHIDKRVRMPLKLIVCHTKYASKYPIEPHLNLLRGRSFKDFPKPKDRLLKPVEYQHHFLPKRGQQYFLLLTTPASMGTHLIDKVVITHRYAVTEIRRKKEFSVPKAQNISALIAALIAIDEAHRYSNKDVAPWTLIRKLAFNHREPSIASALPMSGTPLVVGPSNLMGPLSVMKDPRMITDDDDDDPHGLTLAELDVFAKRWREMTYRLQKNTLTVEDIKPLTKEFREKIKPFVIRRTKQSLWFRQPLLPVPPAEVRTIHDIPYCERYRSMYDEIKLRFKDRIAAELKRKQDEWDQLPEKDQEHRVRPTQVSETFCVTLGRQLMLAASIPWLLRHWLANWDNPDKYRAADFQAQYLDGSGRMKANCPLHEALKHREDVPKFTYLDRVLQQVHREGGKLLIFTQYLVVASFIVEHINTHPEYRMKTNLYHRGLSEERLNGYYEGFEEKTEDIGEGDEVQTVRTEVRPDFCPQVLVGTFNALGTGLTILKGTRIIMWEPNSKPTDEEQALGRAHRVNQKNTLVVWKFACCGPGGVSSEDNAKTLNSSRAMFVETGELWRPDEDDAEAVEAVDIE